MKNEQQVPQNQEERGGSSIILVALLCIIGLGVILVGLMMAGVIPPLGK